MLSINRIRVKVPRKRNSPSVQESCDKIIPIKVNKLIAKQHNNSCKRDGDAEEEQNEASEEDSFPLVP
jgi:hypothetical protein